MNANSSPIVMTRYYFETFIVGIHHSIPHLIADLLAKKEDAHRRLLKSDITSYEKNYNNKLIELIDEKLSTLDINELDDLELAENSFWVNQLGRQCALEIVTYGRVRPETMNLLLCMEEDDFVAAMSISNRLSKKIMKLADEAADMGTPIPKSMPTI